MRMWAVLVLTLAVVAGASDPTNESSVEEKPVIARAKLMVSGERDAEIQFVYNIFRIFMEKPGRSGSI